MIRTENLRKSYQQGETKIPAVDGVSLQIEQGEFIAIVGKSGSGKSTLLHLLGGLDTPTEGSVFYDDVNLSQLKEHRRPVSAAYILDLFFRNII